MMASSDQYQTELERLQKRYKELQRPTGLERLEKLYKEWQPRTGLMWLERRYKELQQRLERLKELRGLEWLKKLERLKELEQLKELERELKRLEEPERLKELKELERELEQLKELEPLKSCLFKSVMDHNWDRVVETYITKPLARRAQITKLNDTALHIAVSTGRSDIAMKLLGVIYDNEEDDILVDVVNTEGNTPLHLAAAQGDLEVCKKIAFTSNPQVLNVRNNKGETPLFLAASNGKEKTFFFLHSRFPQEQLLRRSDGSTVLHMAISREYFRMALKIIGTYPSIAGSVDENGLSPLHILANMPNAFRSSTPLALYDRIIYYFCQVEDAFVGEETYFKEEEDSENEDGRSKNYPANYKTCMIFIELLQRIFLIFFKRKNKRKDDNRAHEEEQDEEKLSGKIAKKHEVPATYDLRVSIFKVFQAILIRMLSILRVGIWRLNKIREIKRRHIQAKLLMYELFWRPVMIYSAESDPMEIMGQRYTDDVEMISDQLGFPPIPQTKSLPSLPILTAAKAGIVEIIEKTLEYFPEAIQDVDSKKKNVVLLAVENRQPHVYHRLVELNKEEYFPMDAFSQVDDEGNSALHLVANIPDKARQSSLMQGSMLQMQREIKWYEFVKNSMPPNFFPLFNKDRQTAREIFLTKHKDLMKDSSEWFSKTSESCSVVAALVASVAFATATTVPGGIKADSGAPTLEDKPAFITFAISSLFALCSSVTALGFFLAILTSRNQYEEFIINLPRKLLLAFTFLFISIVSMLVSFFEGHTFVLKDELRDVSYPLYATLCFPLAVYASSLLSLYVELLRSTFGSIPEKNIDTYN